MRGLASAALCALLCASSLASSLPRAARLPFAGPARRLAQAGGANGSGALLPLRGGVGGGAFTARLQLGVPGQDFDVLVDTGSVLTVVPCSDCGSACGPHEARHFPLSAFSRLTRLALRTTLSGPALAATTARSPAPPTPAPPPPAAASWEAARTSEPAAAAAPAAWAATCFR